MKHNKGDQIVVTIWDDDGHTFINLINLNQGLMEVLNLDKPKGPWFIEKHVWRDLEHIKSAALPNDSSWQMFGHILEVYKV